MITVIGDVHGKLDKYLDITRKCEYTVQLGDLAFDYSPIDSLDNTKHKMIMGNHDNYNSRPFNDLGDYGPSELNGIKFYFVRGAQSIDRQYRQEFVDWFPDEELTYSDMLLCANEYEELKPEIVFSHDAPYFLKGKMLDSPFRIQGHSQTQSLLELLYNIHKPKLWVFGHWHQDKSCLHGPTTFICLNELSTLNIAE